MDDSSQLEVPPSFMALYTSPSGYRLTEPIAVVRERYETCEDLTQMLTDQAATTLFKSGLPEREVLAGIRVALEGTESPLQPPEAMWVVRRLAELLGWEPPQA